MALAAEFTDPVLVAAYETLNAYAADAQPAFYRRLAAELGAATVVDLGCGTGLITRDLARHGHRMIGVDPSPAMLTVARARPGGNRVRWIVGGADDIGTPGADLAIMSGHVAQFFLTDESWRAALAALREALRPRGRLAFESRNPGAREWERWTPDARWWVEDPVAGPIECWTDVHGVHGGIVSCANHYRFVATGEERVSVVELRFRTREELARSLTEAGFAVERVDGDWDGRPAGAATRELIVVAAR